MDKFWPQRKLKELVNACHEQGIAVIMDMFPTTVLEPTRWCGLPGCRGAAEDNPWFNRVKHAFSPGYDFNHEDPWTREFWKRVFDFWLDEFHLDGYRVDLSKGLTQTNTGSWAHGINTTKAA